MSPHDERPTQPNDELSDLPETPVADATAEQVRGGLGATSPGLVNVNAPSRAASTSSSSEQSAN
jgi:hypothetical protein